jgi:hypothetical protein
MAITSMAQTTLDQILGQLETLEPQELQKLNQVVQDYLTPGKETARVLAFHKSLLASGLVRQIKRPLFRQTERQLIQVHGSPISETIIEERR